MVVGRLHSYWEGNFSGAMLNFGRVTEHAKIYGWSTYPPKCTTLRNKGFIAGLVKGKQWLIRPDHKAGYSWEGYVRRGAPVDQSLEKTACTLSFTEEIRHSCYAILEMSGRVIWQFRPFRVPYNKTPGIWGILILVEKQTHTNIHTERTHQVT